MLNVLVAAALTAGVPTDVPEPVTRQSDPAMFVVRDADTTVYLFGTFHALDGQNDWFRDEVENAFDRSNELVLETLIPEGPIVPAPKPLRAPSVAASASFLATTRMAINAGKSQGMRVGNGADMVLRHVAEEEGKPVEGLETLESQLTMFTKLPGPGPSAAPAVKSANDASSMQSLSKAMTDMQAAWKRGDQNVFVQMLDQLSRSSPETYRMLFVERNARWADWVAARMQTPGTVFVAVGAGHLAGKDSLLVRLAEHGIPSTRVN